MIRSTAFPHTSGSTPSGHASRGITSPFAGSRTKSRAISRTLFSRFVMISLQPKGPRIKKKEHKGAHRRDVYVIDLGEQRAVVRM